MKITKEAVLENLETVKNFISEIDTEKNKEEEKIVGIAIMSKFGGIKFQSTKTTFKEAVVEGKANLSDADLSDANLRDADLRDADLSGAELQNAKFYGRGGTKVIKKANLAGFLGALGFVLEE